MQGTSFLLAEGEDVWVLGERYTIPNEEDDKQSHEQVTQADQLTLTGKVVRLHHSGECISGLVTEYLSLKARLLKIVDIRLGVADRQWQLCSWTMHPGFGCPIAKDSNL